MKIDVEQIVVVGFVCPLCDIDNTQYFDDIAVIDDYFKCEYCEYIFQVENITSVKELNNER